MTRIRLADKNGPRTFPSSNSSLLRMPTPKPFHITKLGKIFCADSSVLLPKILGKDSVDLIMTSPPFGLVRKKDYGNEDADRYVAWFEQFAEEFIRLLKPNGSLVIDIGGAWKKGQPTRSLYHYELVVMLCRKFDLHLAQEFFWWNPAKLPTPAEWVTVRRVRVKDAVNYIYWLSKTPYPKASNRRILQPYSASMLQLLDKGYKPKLRPSGHDISSKFQTDNGGAIPPNLIASANTGSNSYYQRYCRERKLPEHPARYPGEVPGFFIRMLTDKNDLVLDPFAGSCVTGAVAEAMGRRWVCIENDEQYVRGALGRFQPGTQERPFATKTEPYQINAPALNGADEARIPLLKDGGKTRPTSTKRKS